jgi:ATP-dependent helicase/nuclease subunit A
VRYIENLKKYEIDYGEANIGSEASDTVRIMSIHKSKGLEFPIVFVSGLGKQFNESDVRGKVVMHPEFGIACDYVDLEQRTRQATILKKVIRQKTSSENLGEELRVLYVALTRAKEKLILTGAVADAAERINKWKSAAMYGREELSYSRLSAASTYLDWVVPALLRHPAAEPLFEAAGLDGSDVIRPEYTIAQMEHTSVNGLTSENAQAEHSGANGLVSENTQADYSGTDSLNAEISQADCGFTNNSQLFYMRLIPAQENEHEDQQERSDEAVRLSQLLNLDPAVCYDEETRCYLEGVFSASYPYEKNREIVGKMSVSELKKRSQVPEDENVQELYEPEVVVPLIPEFRAEQETLVGAARGTAYHTFMENFDYSRKDELQIQLEELISCGKMSEEEGRVVSVSDIQRFLQSETGRRAEQAALTGNLFRERPFVLGVPADTIRKDWDPQETVLVQGIIDAYFLEDGQITVLDYKTDRVSHPQELVNRYGAQLDYYALALKRLTGYEIRDRIIYSFCLGRDIVL